MTDKIINLLQNGNSQNVELAVQLSKALPDIDKKVILDMCLDIVLSNSNPNFDQTLFYWIDNVIEKIEKPLKNIAFTLCDFNYTIITWGWYSENKKFILRVDIKENFLI